MFPTTVVVAAKCMAHCQLAAVLQIELGPICTQEGERCRKSAAALQ